MMLCSGERLTKEYGMLFSNVGDSEKLAILTVILDEVCAAAGFEEQSDERREVASLLTKLYWNGYRTAEGLRQAFVAYAEWETTNTVRDLQSFAREPRIKTGSL
jgi:hypothetical protein